MKTRTFSFYDPATGLFTGQRFSGDDDTSLATNTPTGLAALEGAHDHTAVRVVDGQVAQRDDVPADHYWDYGGGKFVPRSRLQMAIDDQAARARIAELERQQIRPHRELVRDPMNTEARKRIEAIDEEIATLRPKLRQPFNL
jgi:hypothetical protein